MSSLIDSEITRWFRFLSRWALLAGFVNLGFLVAFFIVVLPASQNSAGWLTFGGLFIILAALFARRAPIRSACP